MTAPSLDGGSGHAAAAPPASGGHMPRPSSARGLAAMMLLALAGILAGGAWYYRVEHERIRLNCANQLQAISALMCHELASWRRDQIRNAELTKSNPYMAEAVVKILAGDRGAALDKLRTQFEQLRKRYGYREIILADPAGKILVRLSGTLNPLSQDMLSYIDHCKIEPGVILSDLHPGAQDRSPHLDVVTPIHAEPQDSESPVLGYIFFRVDAQTSLYPLLASWPFPTRTAETLLVRREGDTVLFLNELRFQTNTALTLTFPLDRTNLPAVMAVLGTQAVVEGRDYRGVPVLSAVRPVPDSPWYTVTKIDLEEAYAEWRRLSRLIAVLILGLLAAALAVMGLLWQLQGKAYYHALYQAEEARHRSEAQYRNLVETSQDLIWECDIEGRYTYLNPAWEKVFGYPTAVMLGRKFYEFQPPDMAARDREVFARLLKEGSVKGLETVHLGQSGNAIHLVFNARSLADESGRVCGTRGTAYDITDRKKTEAALRASEEKYRRIVDNVNDALVIHDFKGHILEVNDQACRLFGYTRSELVGANLGLIDTPENTRNLPARMEQLMRENSVVFECVHLRKDGAQVPTEVSGKVVTREGAGIIQGFIRDITARKKTEADLVKARDAAEEASRAKTLFLANMNHELRTPLNPILGFAGLLSEAPNLTGEQRTWLSIIQRRSEDLLTLIGMVLDLAKIEAGRITLQPQRLEVRATVRELVETMTPMARKKGLSLEWTVSPATPEWVLADGLRLRQVLLNLLTNALKFTTRGGIAVRVEPGDAGRLARKPAPDEVAFLVHIADSGIGIPEDRHEAIFEAFTQANEEHSVRFGGAGLGLSIARRLVELMGGRIWVASAPGRGSTFSFTFLAGLPRAPADAGAGQGVAAESGPPRARQVLVVDDDADNLLLAEERMRKEGYEVHVASDGQQAVARMEQTVYDLVLMDIRMPGMDGLEATQAIRERDRQTGRHTTVIALTAHAMAGDRERFLAAGLDGYLAKPLQTEALREEIRKTLAAPHGPET